MPVLCRGLIRLALRREGDAEIVVSIGTAGIEGDGALVTEHAVGGPALRDESDGEIVESIGVVGLKRKREAVALHGVLDPAQREERGSQVVMGFGVVRVEENGALVSRHCLGRCARQDDGVVLRRRSFPHDRPCGEERRPGSAPFAAIARTCLAFLQRSVRGCGVHEVFSSGRVPVERNASRGPKRRKLIKR